MSASSTPTESPFALRPNARLAATVDLPTPPLPEATAMMAPTPGPAPPRPICAAGPGQRLDGHLRGLAQRFETWPPLGLDLDREADIAIADDDAGDHVE